MLLACPKLEPLWKVKRGPHPTLQHQETLLRPVYPCYPSSAVSVAILKETRQLPAPEQRRLTTECFLVEQVHTFSDISSLEAAVPQNGRQGVNMGSHFTGKETGALLR